MRKQDEEARGERLCVKEKSYIQRETAMLKLEEGGVLL